MLILLQVKINAIFKKKICKKNFVKTFNFQSSKTVMILLTNIVAI